MPQYTLFIDGRRTEAASGHRYESVDPFLGLPWASAADGDAADVDLAVAAARRAVGAQVAAAAAANITGVLLELGGKSAHLAHRAHRGQADHDRGLQGGVRPGAGRHPLRHRGRSRRAGQRQPLRAGRRDVDQGHPPENGIDAVHEYTLTKAVWVELSGGTRDPFTLG